MGTGNLGELLFLSGGVFSVCYILKARFVGDGAGDPAGGKERVEAPLRRVRQFGAARLDESDGEFTGQGTSSRLNMVTLRGRISSNT